MSKISKYPTEKLSELFENNKIADMSELKKALGTEVDVTVFRKLKDLSYCTSYSNKGSYYTLESIAQFDEMGLWSYRSIRFSRHGNLLQTAQALVESAEEGFLAAELERLLQVRVKDPLLKLVRRGRLARQRISGQYVYLSADLPKQKRQILTRRTREESLNALGPPALDNPAAELKAALVLFFTTLDEKQRRLYAGLESLRYGHGGDRKLAALLGMDVGTIARGRRELMNEDIEANRVRRPGAGRKRVEKKSPK